MVRQHINGGDFATVRKLQAGRTLRDLTEESLRGYLAKLNGDKPLDLYAMVLREIEEPLFRSVMEYTDGNQSRAAEVLGINRGTLRKKLRLYGLSNGR